MDRRQFLSSGTSAALAASSTSGHGLISNIIGGAQHENSRSSDLKKAITRHRFGVNYTPSHNWWFSWNDWNLDPIQRDLDAIAVLGADHLRIMLIWPYFQPNLTWVSGTHLDRLNQLLHAMADRKLDALITVFTGQLSGWYFLPPFNKPDPALYTDATLWKAQELLITELARAIKQHTNIIGFDFGNEMNTCWRATTSVGDAWMAKMFQLMRQECPEGIHVNGVDHHPWFVPDTFSARALAANPFPVIHAYPYWSQALKYGGSMDPPSTHILAAFAALVRSYAGDAQKPVWAGEFNTCIEAMPEKQQAEWLETAVTSAIDSGVSWFSYWDSHDVDRKFAFNSLEYSLGLLTNDGRVKEQGRVFQQLAKSYRGKPVKFPATAPPPPPEVQTTDETWRWLLNYLEWKPRPTGV
jgi:endo-1,4-beta-mannosidase